MQKSEQLVKHFQIKENKQVFGHNEKALISFDSKFLDIPIDKQVQISFNKLDKKNWEISSLNKDNINQGLWAINKKQQFPIKIEKNLVFKIGKQILEVIDIHQSQNVEIKQSRIEELVKSLKESSININHKSLVSGSSRCRICLEPETKIMKFEKDLCSCSKSMPIHIQCLILWMSSKTLIKETDHVKFWDLSKLSCDICQKDFPQTFEQEGKQIKLFQLPEEINREYIELVAYSVEDYSPKGKIRIYDQDLENQSFTIGRLNSSNLNFKDVTISRTHAMIFRNQKNWYIQDNDSKFGTLVKINKSVDQKFLQQNDLISSRFCFSFHFFKNKFCCPKHIQNLCEKTMPHPFIQLYQQSIKEIKHLSSLKKQDKSINESLVSRGSDLNVSDSLYNEEEIFQSEFAQQQADNFIQKNSIKTSTLLISQLASKQRKSLNDVVNNNKIIQNFLTQKINFKVNEENFQNAQEFIEKKIELNDTIEEINMDELVEDFYREMKDTIIIENINENQINQKLINFLKCIFQLNLNFEQFMKNKNQKIFLLTLKMNNQEIKEVQFEKVSNLEKKLDSIFQELPNQFINRYDEIQKQISNCLKAVKTSKKNQKKKNSKTLQYIPFKNSIIKSPQSRNISSGGKQYFGKTNYNSATKQRQSENSNTYNSLKKKKRNFGKIKHSIQNLQFQESHQRGQFSGRQTGDIYSINSHTLHDNSIHQLMEIKKDQKMKSSLLYEKKFSEEPIFQINHQKENFSFKEKKNLQNNDLMNLFSQLDTYNLGVIGAKNIDFRSIPTNILKKWNFLIIEIFKNPKLLYDFEDFKKLTETLMKQQKKVNQEKLNQLQTYFLHFYLIKNEFLN